ncbi:MAG: hypothetical protein J1F35_03535 [Erysipelotrichales bacterium]|nr:hypothetical protein [Erysipelotrichales bacterium]
MASEELVQLLIDQGYIKARGNKIKYFPDNRKDQDPKYDPKYQDVIFFCLDTYEILLNGQNYGGDLKGIKQNLLEEYDSETADTYVIEKNTEDDLLQLTFTPLSPGTLGVPLTIGDIKAGTLSSELNGKALSEILDMMLFKTIYPTITPTSVSLSGNSTTTVKPGSTLKVENTPLKYTYNKGTAKLISDTGTTNATVDGTYGGNEISHQWQVSCSVGASDATNYPIGENKAKALSNVTLDQLTRYEVGTYTYRVQVVYGEGPIIKTSKGATPKPKIETSTGSLIDNPAPGSTIYSAPGFQVNCTLPLLVDYGGNEEDILSNYVEQSLQPWGSWSFVGIPMKPVTGDTPCRILTPRKIDKIMSYNEVSGKYDVDQSSNFTKFSDVEKVEYNINGKTYTYFKYKWIGGANAAVNYQITTS